MRGVLSSTEGNHVDEAGNLITCTYVDFRNPVERTPITTLYKASSRRHADLWQRDDSTREAKGSTQK